MPPVESILTQFDKKRMYSIEEKGYVNEEIMDLYGGAHDAFKWMPDPPGTGGAHGEYRGGKGDRPGRIEAAGRRRCRADTIT